MNDTYFFGKRMSFNEGGRARFNVGGTGNKDAEEQGFNYISNNQYLQDDFKGSTPLDFSNVSSSGIMSQAPVPAPLAYIPQNEGGGGGGDDDDDDDTTTTTTGKFGLGTLANILGFVTNPIGFIAGKAIKKGYNTFKDRKTVKDIETTTVPGGGSSRDPASGGSFGSSVNEATGARGSGTGFSDYS